MAHRPHLQPLFPKADKLSHPSKSEKTEADQKYAKVTSFARTPLLVADFAIPPMPSQGPFPWLEPKKERSTEKPRSSFALAMSAKGSFDLN